MNKFEKQIKMMILETLLKEEEEILEAKIEDIMLSGVEDALTHDYLVEVREEDLDFIRNSVRELLRQVLRQ